MSSSGGYPQENFVSTRFDDSSLISRRRHAVFENTLLYQLRVLKETGRYDAFRLQWHPSYADPPNVWPIPNHLFWDSDVAKWIESACYFLESKQNECIRNAVEELVRMISRAQQSDGYINIHYTVVAPGKRFTNLRDFHELYNAGHLIEAALAHQRLFQNSELLDPIVKYADLLVRTFGSKDDQIKGYPGHPEIELALLRLYERTKKGEYLDLARHFLEERGNPSGASGDHFFTMEARNRGDDLNARPDYHTERGSLWYYQAHKPLAEQESIEGHAVRATYLLTAAADLVRIQPKDSIQLWNAVSRLWFNMVNRKMYVTGGIGAIPVYEGFGKDYFLPQSEDEGGCYAETCAAIGVMMLAQRMLQVSLDGKFADIMELCLYNAVLTGMSFDGKRFTYDNPLASSDTNASRREAWFTCACCPPNISRLLGSIGGYLWDWKSSENQCDDVEIRVHMFTSATLTFNVHGREGTLQQQASWPWHGKIRFRLNALQIPVTLRIRIPGWCKEWRIPSAPENLRVENGYIRLDPQWTSTHSEFDLIIKIEPRFLTPHPYTNQDTISVARGPLVYCAEDVDNPWVDDHFKGLMVDPPLCKIAETEVEDPMTKEFYVGLSLKGGISAWSSMGDLGPSLDYDKLDDSVSQRQDCLILVPYYFRANRKGRGQMRVGFKRGRAQSRRSLTNGFKT